MTPLERMEVELACTRQINRFAMLNDAHDHHELAALFTQDGSFARPTDPDTPISGRSTILDFFKGRPKRITKHVMGNTVVEVLSTTQATARSEVILYVGQQQGDQVIIMQTLVGEFHDHLQKTEDGWLFSKRRGTLTMQSPSL